jgi:hypothetical protein
LLPVFFGCGLLSAWLFYRKNESSAIDPFFVRSWMSLLGGLVALPICLVFRPSVADLAFIAPNFSLGPILGFHHYRSIIEPTKSRRPDLFRRRRRSLSFRHANETMAHCAGSVRWHGTEIRQIPELLI